MMIKTSFLTPYRWLTATFSLATRIVKWPVRQTAKHADSPFIASGLVLLLLGGIALTILLDDERFSASVAIAVFVLVLFCCAVLVDYCSYVIPIARNPLLDEIAKKYVGGVPAGGRRLRISEQGVECVGNSANCQHIDLACERVWSSTHIREIIEDEWQKGWALDLFANVKNPDFITDVPVPTEPPRYRPLRSGGWGNWHFLRLEIGNGDDLVAWPSLRRYAIGVLDLGPNIYEVLHIKECYIHQLEIRKRDPDHCLRIRLEDCLVGHLRIGDGSYDALTIEGGGIRLVDFRGSANAAPHGGVLDISPSTYIGAISDVNYCSDIAAHGLKSLLRNSETTSPPLSRAILRAAIHRKERYGKIGFVPTISWLYDISCGYLTAAARPFIWGFLLCCISFSMYILWTSVLNGNTTTLECFTLAFRPILDPAGLYLEATNIKIPIIRIFASVQNVVSLILVFLGILGLRRRFQL